ncbi:MAG: DUF5615 family PIN-like protein [Dehalococcoidia bacterium]
MRLLLDSCIWGPTAPPLIAAGHDVVWAGNWSEDPGDEHILRIAHDEDRILITLDKDFGKLAVVHGLSHSGIVRLVRIPAQQQAAVCLYVLNIHGEELSAGAIVTAERGRLRIRRPDDDSETDGGQR